MAAWVLLAAGLRVVLVGGVLGIGVYDRMVRQGHAEAVDRTSASETLLDGAPTIGSVYATGSSVGVHAT